jgi:hypothetical protein
MFILEKGSIFGFCCNPSEPANVFNTINNQPAMRKNRFILLLLSTIFLLYGCPIHYGYKYPNGKIPEIPVNLNSVNSPFDDINMTAPVLVENTLLMFSSNRGSEGGQFDIISHPLSFIWNKTEGNFSVNEDDPERFKYLDRLLETTRSTGNEYGPLSFIQTNYSNNKYTYKQYLFYSCDTSGTNNIYWMSYTFNSSDDFNDQFNKDSISGPFAISFLNDPRFDEMYFTLKMSPWKYDYISKPTDNVFEKIIYCENSEGNFDLASIDIPENIPLDTFLMNGKNVTKIKLDNLNSAYNDRCPYVCGNFMVFSSDRPGGLGGYDFYWSVYDEGRWSDPVNFGAPVNTEYNEYRAIAENAFEFDNQLLIFSSDRPGGKGGYDLYYAGIDVMPEVRN